MSDTEMKEILPASSRSKSKKKISSSKSTPDYTVEIEELKKLIEKQNVTIEQLRAPPLQQIIEGDLPFWKTTAFAKYGIVNFIMFSLMISCVIALFVTDKDQISRDWLYPTITGIFGYYTDNQGLPSQKKKESPPQLQQPPRGDNLV